MKYGHAVAWAKCWYQYRSRDISKWWMDLAHCIDQDGITVFNKADVARYCANQIDTFQVKHPDDYHMWSFSRLFDEINNIKRQYKFFSKSINPDEKELDDESAIIYVWRSLMQSLDNSYFDEWHKPDNFVLPLKMYGSCISKGIYNTIGKDEWIPGDMLCDVKKRIDEAFSDATEDYVPADEKRFNCVEERLHIDEPKDVLVRIGDDYGSDIIIKNISGHILNHPLSSPFGVDDEIVYLELKNFTNCEFDNNKTYECRIKVVNHIDVFGDKQLQYHLKSVREL